MADKKIGDHLLVKTHVADAALVDKRFVKPVSPGGNASIPHVVYAGAGELAIGVTRDAYASGKLADVIYVGTAWVTAASNITAGQAVAAAANGQAAPATTANEVLGVALRDANTGEDCLVKLGYAGIF
jgi:hypothetical protein